MQPAQNQPDGNLLPTPILSSPLGKWNILASPPATIAELAQNREALIHWIGFQGLDGVTPSTNLITGDRYQIQYASTGNFSLIDLAWQQTLQLSQKQPDSLYVIYIPCVGSIALQINSHQTINCFPNTTAAIANPGQDAVGMTSEQGKALLIGVERTIVEQALINLLGRAVKQPVVFEPEINLTYDFGNNLQQFAQLLRQGLADEAGRSSLVLEELKQAFLTFLVKGVPHNYSEALLYQRIGALGCYVRKAQMFIETNLQSDIRLGDIAAAAGVCPRTLEKAFAYHCDISPMQFLKRVRLQHVREELCQATPGTNVAEVMMRYGFTQGGKFAKAYRELFGELPSETLKRHRKA
jgi:AraC-like DNA-binding protein